MPRRALLRGARAALAALVMLPMAGAAQAELLVIAHRGASGEWRREHSN